MTISFACDELVIDEVMNEHKGKMEISFTMGDQEVLASSREVQDLIEKLSMFLRSNQSS